MSSTRDGTASATSHLPHGWDAGVLFEEKTGLLLYSDLFHQVGDVEPLTTSDVVERWGKAMEAYHQHPLLMDYMPFTPNSRARLEDLAAPEPKILAAMHRLSATAQPRCAPARI